MQSAVKRFRPLLDRVLVQKVKPKTMTASGIHLPEDVTMEKIKVAKVISVGAGKLDSVKGEISEMQIKAGDQVVCPDFGGTSVHLDGQEYFLYHHDDILGFLNE